MAKRQIHINESQLHKLVESALNEWEFWDKYIAGNPKAYGRDLEGERNAAQNDPRQIKQRERRMKEFDDKQRLQQYRDHKRAHQIAQRGEEENARKDRERSRRIRNSLNQPTENESLIHKVTENIIKRINESSEQTVTITMDDYIKLLNARRAEVEPRGWTIPDCVWNYFIEIIEDCGTGDNPQHNSPSYVVDNIAVNGDYGNFDNYKEEGESDEDFIAREQDNCMQIFPEERYIIYSL
ncbi:MAG: hypothetical protein LUD72_11815 [Bacteroidales bacterium]|nr:hypothetical protein [Bacteroidales bacterium]